MAQVADLIISGSITFALVLITIEKIVEAAIILINLAARFVRGGLT